MTSFEIYRWDSLISDNPLFPFPGIYIKPKPELIQYANQNNGILNVIIRDSDSIYDNKLLSGILSNSEIFPSNRKNFFKKTGYYIISLNSYFYQFPPKNGVVEVQNFFINDQPGNIGDSTNGNAENVNLKNIKDNILKTLKKTMYKKDGYNFNNNSKYNNPQFYLSKNITYGLYIFFLIIVIIILYIVLRK